MKKLLSVFMFLMLCVPAASVQAEEDSVWKYNEMNSYLSLEGELSGEVEVPAEIDGYQVTALESNALSGQNRVTSVILPDSIEALQSGNIDYMDALEKVKLSENLAYIRGCFSKCPSLTSITIPASVSYIESSFYWCDNLKEIRFEGVCPVFAEKDWNFSGLPDDCVIYVPDDQMDVYAEALADINGAADRLKPGGQKAVTVDFTASEDEFVFDEASGTITGYTGSSARLEIPAQIGGVPVKAIGEDAFHGNYYIYYVTFPEGLETIGDRSFSQASNLGYIAFPSTLKTIGEEAFFNVGAPKIDWSEGVEEIGDKAFMYDREPILTLPSTVKTIGESAFESSLCSELYLSGDLEKIGSRAFAGTSLDYMAFDFYEAIDIASDAFADNYIYDLDLPWDSSIENREAYAAMLKDQCADCTVWINNPPDEVAQYPENEAGVTTIGNGVWKEYHGDGANLTVWTHYDDIPVTRLGDGLFMGNQTICSFYPHHCGWFTTIGGEAFADSSVEYVEMFPSITTIGAEAFRNCTNITELSLPDSLTDIGEGAFRGCTGITELTLPASLTSIGADALDGCTGLKKLTVLCDPSLLPENLLTGCTALTEVYASADATDEQISVLSVYAGYPWYSPVPRVGEKRIKLIPMPYEPLPGGDFWYDEEYSRLDQYNGYELNLILPREIDGVPLAMIGGNMMSRATNGDNFDIELPVVSLVIPESYTEIPAYAFENCETLETVICYAPIENLQDCTFKGCSNLRKVIFVNGVHNVSKYAFPDCPKLKTVYLGEFTEEIGEATFLDESGNAGGFAVKDCITSREQMPDVDALLEAVKSDPIPSPTPEPEVVAVPIGEEGVAFFGTWYGKSMEMEGTVLDLQELGMVMQLTLNEDGTLEIFDGEETDKGVWTFTDGIAYIDSVQYTLTENGELCMEEEGTKMIFSREAPEGAAAGQSESEPEAEPETEVQAMEDVVYENSDLKEFRKFLADIDCICGVIYLGWVDGGSGSYSCDKECIRYTLNETDYPENYSFLEEITDDRIVGEYGCELYCIIPRDPYSSVTVNEYVFDEPDDYIGRAGDVLYQSENGEPFLLICNVSDIIRNTQITIEKVFDSDSLVWKPGLSLENGAVDVPWEAPYIYDATYYENNDWYEEGAPAGKTMQVVNCQEWVSFREGPDVNTTRLDTVPLGTVLVNCFEDINGFYSVEYKGRYGYVHSDYLAEIQGASVNSEENSDYLFGKAGEWRTEKQIQETGKDIVYRLQFFTDESGVEGQMIFSFDDPYLDNVSSWHGTYFANDPLEYTCGQYMYFLDTPDGYRYGDISLVFSGDTMTITEGSGDAFWPFTSRETETLRFYPY